jgi:hypothetical protein
MAVPVAAAKLINQKTNLGAGIENVGKAIGMHGL